MGIKKLRFKKDVCSVCNSNFNMGDDWVSYYHSNIDKFLPICNVCNDVLQIEDEDTIPHLYKGRIVNLFKMIIPNEKDNDLKLLIEMLKGIRKQKKLGYPKIFCRTYISREDMILCNKLYVKYKNMS